MRIGWKPKSTDATVASVRFRCLVPLQWLRDNGFNVEIFDASAAEDYDIVVFSKLYGGEDQALAKRRRALGKKSVLDLSDNHFYNPHEQAAYDAAASNIRAMVRLVDAVVCCSDYLAEVVKSECPDAPPCHVVSDAVEALNVNRIGERSLQEDAGLHLLWFGSHGSPNAPGGLEDLSLLRDRLKGAVLPPGTKLTVLSNNREKFDQISSSLPMTAEYVDWSTEEFGSLLSVVDAVVLPIRQNPFTLSKSENRVTTPLWYGVPVISDPIPAYEKLSRFAFVGAWAEGFNTLAANRPQMDERTKAGQRYVRQMFDDEQIARAWWRVFEHTVGSITAPPYLTTPAAIAELRDIPLSGRLYGRSDDSIVARLRTERALAAGDSTTFAIVYVLDRPADTQLVRRLRALDQHSVPIGCVFLFVDPPQLDKVRQWRGAATPKNLNTVILCDEDELKRAIGAFDWVVFLRQDEWLDPSAMNAVRRLGHDNALMIWARATTERPDRVSIIRTSDPFSIEHLQTPTFGNACAIPGKWCQQYPGDLGAELRDLRLHLFTLWLRAKGVTPIFHDEILHYSSGNSTNKIDEATRQKYKEAYTLLLSDILADTPLTIEWCGIETTVRPRQHAPKGVSVIIPYRDRAADTVGAIRSLIDSRVSDIALEFILVNNQSSPDEQRMVVEETAALLSANISVLYLAYDAPFNHSAQINLGANKARFETLLFLNNDVCIDTPGTIEAAADWANLPDTSTVGIRLIHPITGATSDGFQVRTRRLRLDDSPVQEASSGDASIHVREVFGNTLAFACIRRDIFLSVGAANERLYPIGYNDVALACEAKRRGLTAYCLSHFQGTHAPGQSRGKTEEGFEKTLIRQQFGHLFATPICGLTVDTPKDLKSAFLEAPALPEVRPAPAPARSRARRLISQIVSRPPVSTLLRNKTIYIITRRLYRLTIKPILQRT